MTLSSARLASAATLLGQVVFPVAVTIGFLAFGAALPFSLTGVGTLIAQSLGGASFRTGAFALSWLT